MTDGSSGPEPAPETHHVTAPRCDDCGRRLEGVICVVDPDPVLNCPQCAPSEPRPGVYVRQVYDPDVKRWHPIEGMTNRLSDGYDEGTISP